MEVGSERPWPPCLESVLESMAECGRSRSGVIYAVRTVLWRQPWVVKRKVCGRKVKEEVA